MQTLADKRAQLRSLVTGSRHTFGVTQQAFDNHTDQLIDMTQHLTPVLGVLALHSRQVRAHLQKLNHLADKFFDRSMGSRTRHRTICG